MLSGRQEQDGDPAGVTMHELYGPHGDGTHGSIGAAGEVGTGSTAVKKPCL